MLAVANVIDVHEVIGSSPIPPTMRDKVQALGEKNPGPFSFPGMLLWVAENGPTLVKGGYYLGTLRVLDTLPLAPPPVLVTSAVPGIVVLDLDAKAGGGNGAE